MLSQDKLVAGMGSQTTFQLRLLGNSIVDGVLYYSGTMPKVSEAVRYGKSIDPAAKENFDEFDAKLKGALTDERKIHAFLMAWLTYKSDSKPEDEFLTAKETLIRRADDCEGFARVADRYMFFGRSERSRVVDMFWIPQMDNPDSREEGWGHETKVFQRNGKWCTLDNWGLAGHGTASLADVVRNFKGKINYYEVYSGEWNRATGELEYREPSETQEVKGDYTEKRKQPFEIDWANMIWV